MIAKEIAWTVGASDMTCGSGVQNDIKTMTGLSVHGCAVITAIKAFEGVTLPTLRGQLLKLADDMPPQALKIGYIDSAAQLAMLVEFISNYKPPFIVYDPDFSAIYSTVIAGETSELLRAIRENLLPICHLVTANIAETLTILDVSPESVPSGDDRGAYDAFVEDLGMKLVVAGPKTVVIKGGARKGSFSQDYFTNGLSGLWLTSLKRTSPSIGGTGDTFSSAIAASVAQGNGILDSLVMAKSYVNQCIDNAPGIGRPPGPIGHGLWLSEQSTLPWLTLTAEEGRHRLAFKPAHNLGFYPIVDSYAMVETMVNAGVKHIQLRIKGEDEAVLNNEIMESARLCRQKGAELFVNDYAQLAIRHGAHGVHLGQADLVIQDLNLISEAGLKLGVTARSYWEMARALALKPSYITVGPIFFDDAPEVEAHHGLSQLVRWRKVLDFPLVAAGGICLENAPGVLSTGVDSIAVYRDLSGMSSDELTARLEKWLRMFERKGMTAGIDLSFDASVRSDRAETPRIAQEQNSGLML